MLPGRRKLHRMRLDVYFHSFDKFPYLLPSSGKASEVASCFSSCGYLIYLRNLINGSHTHAQVEARAPLLRYPEERRQAQSYWHQIRLVARQSSSWGKKFALSRISVKLLPFMCLVRCFLWHWLEKTAFTLSQDFLTFYYMPVNRSNSVWPWVSPCGYEWFHEELCGF